MSKKTDETVILLAQFKDCSKRLPYIPYYIGPVDPTYRYIYEALKKIFSNVIVYDYLERIIETGVKAINEELIELVRKEKPKYVFWLSANHEFLESAFDAIRKEDTIVIGWFFDDEFRFDDYSKWWIPHVDYCVTNVGDAVPKYRDFGARPIQVIPPSGIPTERDWSNIKEKYNVSFVGGSGWPQRRDYINALKKRKVLIHLFGSGWEKYVSREEFAKGEGKSVSLEEMINIFESSKINLNFSGTRDNKLGWKGRIFEVCLAGGFLLTEYNPGIEKYFEIDKEIVCFHNTEEMIEKIRYYLVNEEERRAIAQAGWRKAISEYAPSHIISKVFREIEEDLTKKDKKSYQPKEIKMTKQMRKDFSGYYLQWAVALSHENHKNLWKDALELSMSYNPSNIFARCCYISTFFPSFARRVLFKLYRTVLKISL